MVLNKDVSFTLNTVDKHAVAFADVHASLSANDGPKGPSSQMLASPEENFMGEPAFGIDRAAFNQGRNAKFGFAVESELEPTIVAKGFGAVAHPTYCSSKNSHHTIAEKELANTLVASDYKDLPLVNDEDGKTSYKKSS
jgi:DNA (cytosine-5)-methyltransferase 1